MIWIYNLFVSSQLSRITIKGLEKYCTLLPLLPYSSPRPSISIKCIKSSAAFHDPPTLVENDELSMLVMPMSLLDIKPPCLAGFLVVVTT